MANPIRTDVVDPNNPDYSAMDKIFHQRTAEKHAAHLLPYIKKHFRILDVGCGTGSITMDLARLVPSGEVIGVDVNESWLEQARKLATKAGIKNVRFIKGDVLQLDEFQDESFDIVHAHQVLLHVSDSLFALQEMRRLCRSDGGIVTTRDLVSQIIIPSSPIISNMMTEVSSLMRSRGADLEFGRVHHLQAHEAGFDWADIEMSSCVWEFSRPEDRSAWAEGMKQSYKHAVTSSGKATEEQVAETMAAWDHWAQDPSARFIGVDSALVCHK